MNAIKIVALGLIVAGILALVYGGFSYNKDVQKVELGPVKMLVQDQKTVNIPVWAGVGAIVVGSVFLLVVASKTTSKSKGEGRNRRKS